MVIHMELEYVHPYVHRILSKTIDFQNTPKKTQIANIQHINKNHEIRF